MRTTMSLVCGLSLAAAAMIAVAQDTRVDVQAGRTGVQVGGDHSQHQQAGRVIRASDLMRLNVYNKNNESLGEIEDLVIDPKDAKIRYAVLSFGGILGMGDKLFAIPWEKLSFVPRGGSDAGGGVMKEDYCVLDIPKEMLRQAPGFDKRNWPNFANQDWNRQIDQYYQAQRESTGRDTRR